MDRTAVRARQHAAGATRNVAGRRINRRKRWRRIATRYEKRAAHFQATLTLAAMLLWP